MIGNLTLDQLRVLVTIAEAGSFSAAGRRLGRAQSAISQMIATLENAQGIAMFDRSGFRPVVTEARRVLVAQARAVLSSAARFEAIAAATRDGVEAELAIAIDPLVPTDAFIDSLHALRAEFPCLSVSFSTEGLGGAERRLRRGEAALALCILLPSVPEDVVALPLLGIDLMPVVSANHPLARLNRSVTRSDLAEHVQLVLSDPSTPDGPSYGVVGSRQWRFVDLGRRLDFLLAGMGWCRMPERLVAPHLAAGRLVPIAIEDDPAGPKGTLTIYAAHMRDQPLGRAGSWLLTNLQAQFA